ncbi:MAG: M48 family metallopeptidase [Oscillospiraceae bacterium]|jgi:predicted metal-dependent hydrolase|nr:M48 family metallopeptidase [Oscillospiraceae bacterium]
MQYTLVRQRRKTMGIYIRPDGRVEVRVPLQLSQAQIDQFVAAKEEWVREKSAAMQEKAAQKQAFTVDYGALLLWRGAEIPLRGDSDSSRMWRDEDGFHLPPSLDAETLKHNVIALYKLCAKNYLTGRVAHFASIMGTMPNAVKVNEAKTRWGSCCRHGQNASAHYNLNFSWRLCMAADDVIDAVVVHELAHMQQMNHSAQFYALVKAVLPDYDARSAQLKQLGKRLGCEDWTV